MPILTAATGANAVGSFGIPAIGAGAESPNTQLSHGVVGHGFSIGSGRRHGLGSRIAYLK